MEETANCAEPLTKKKKGDKGNPSGIIDHPSGKKRARLPGFKECRCSAEPTAR